MPKGYFTPYTDKQKEYIKNEYLNIPVKRLADLTNSTYGRVTRFLKKNDLIIPKELIEQRKKESQKKKGHIPFNKGKKQTDYMTKEAIDRSMKTRYRTGHKPHNTYDKDLMVVTRHHKGLYYKYIRLKESQWILYHRYIYEKANGKIPANHIVIFKDKNSLNTNIENLELISMTENMYRNSIQNYPKEIIQSLVLNKQLQNKLKTLQDG